MATKKREIIGTYPTEIQAQNAVFNCRAVVTPNTGDYSYWYEPEEYDDVTSHGYNMDFIYYEEMAEIPIIPTTDWNAELKKLPRNRFRSGINWPVLFTLIFVIAVWGSIIYHAFFR